MHVGDGNCVNGACWVSLSICKALSSTKGKSGIICGHLQLALRLWARFNKDKAPKLPHNLSLSLARSAQVRFSLPVWNGSQCESRPSNRSSTLRFACVLPVSHHRCRTKVYFLCSPPLREKTDAFTIPPTVNPSDRDGAYSSTLTTQSGAQHSLFTHFYCIVACGKQVMLRT